MNGMSRLDLCLTLLAAPLLLAPATLAQPLNQLERDYAAGALHSTNKMFIDTIAGLSDAQMKWKPAPDAWSIAEVAEHIALAEDMLPELARKAMAQPATPEKKQANPRVMDEKIMKTVPVRDQKFKAPEVLQPKSTFASTAALLAAFKASRSRNIDYVWTTQDDLRSHFAPHPVLGDLDCYQWYILMAAHCQRHVNQIQEVMANPDFPKK